MARCAICGRAIDGNSYYLPGLESKPICEKCNYEKYLAKSDPAGHREYFAMYASRMDVDVAAALDAMLPGLGISQKLNEELAKRSFANSFDEYYEYDIETVINEGHGVVDRAHMLEIINRHTREGWRLHSVYSNELGKNALIVLGLGVNVTACEDVLIFERRIPKMG